MAPAPEVTGRHLARGPFLSVCRSGEGSEQQPRVQQACRQCIFARDPILEACGSLEACARRSERCLTVQGICVAGIKLCDLVQSCRANVTYDPFQDREVQVPETLEFGQL